MDGTSVTSVTVTVFRWNYKHLGLGVATGLGSVVAAGGFFSAATGAAGGA